ncbi:response regulator [Patescibacteria group bacterium]|nr:response regulator [Patescibacteria group bacterium]MBU4580664.1 response regulator [Patescibacteria group bacterium]
MKKEKTKILIVEDDNFLVKAYQIKFERSGFNVFIAMDGEEGLKIVRKEKPALIILDLMLPKMNGFEFLKKIKSDENMKNIPVVALSNLGQRADQEKAISLGAAEYFIKTEHTLEEIIEKISKYL